ncbi:MAG: ABC transporter permease [Rhodobacteraceae bacterium]|nr:ABC transporter permease [Paracoccaceae bacterium]
MATLNSNTDLETGAQMDFVSRLRHGELGFVPVIFALFAVFLVFHLANPYFLTPRNLSNLTLQLGVLGIMALGVSLVLFIGEIDLSAGSVSGACAVVLVLLSTELGLPGLLAAASAIAVGAAIGWLHGTCVTLIGAPSFIVTLTGLLVWQGVQRMLVGNQIGQMLINDPLITGIASTFIPSWMSLLLIGLTSAAALIHFGRQWSAAVVGGIAEVAIWLARAALYPLLAIAVYAILSQHSGVPVLLLILAALTLVLTVLTEHTPFGTHIFAVGGNAEAARRAGINVSGIRVLLFAMCSSMAAMSGIVAVSRQYAVDSNTGGGNLVLDAIAAAVIGGTSLFGGRGRILGSLLGALVIGSVANGLDLLGQSANVKSIITGLILLGAVSVDMIARKRRIRSGAAGA